MPYMPWLPLCQLSQLPRFQVLAILALVLWLGAVPALAADAGESHLGELVIHLEDAGASQEGRHYVALIAEGRPLSRPTLERVVEGIGPFSVSVPEGRYHLVCQSEGRGPSFSRVEVGGEEGVEVRCSPTALSRFQGCVVDQEGRPIPGAAVGPPALFDATSQGRFSGMGRGFTIPSLSALTGSTGCFQLDAQPSSQINLWVEATGYLPQRIDDFALTEKDLGNFRLTPAVPLHLSFEVPDMLEPDHYLVGLSADPPPNDPDTWIPPAGASVQPLSSAVLFPGLPAGRYMAWLIDRRGAVVPADLGLVDLKPGVRGPVTLPLPPLAGDSETSDGLLLELDAPRDHQLSGAAVWTWAGGTATPWSGPQALERKADRILLRLATCPVDKDVQVTAVGLASPLFRPTAENCSSRKPLQIQLSSTQAIFGSVEVSRGYGRPESARILLPAEADSTAPGKAFPVRIDPDEDGTWAAAIPFAKSLSFKAPGFLPHPIRLEGTVEGGTLDVGVQRLRPEAVLLLRVVGDSAAGHRVDLFRDSDIEDLVSHIFMMRGVRPDPITGGVADENGWVRLDGLPPGNVRVLLSPLDGQLPTLSDPITLDEGAELLIDGMAALAASRLRIALTSRSMAPALADLEVLVVGSSDCHWKSEIYRVAQVMSDGTAQIGPLPPGNWRVAVQTQGSLQTLLIDSVVELLPGEDRYMDLEVEGSFFHGSVTGSGRPVEAAVTLQDSTGNDVASTTTDERGFFSVLVPVRGTYDVRVISQDLGQIHLVPEVEFEVPDDEVLVTLPEGELSGVVVDADGSPRSDAKVNATQARGLEGLPTTSAVKVAEDGSFTLARLGEGRWEVQASSGDLKSEAAAISLSEDERRSGLVLRLVAGRRFQGTLTREGQGLANTPVWTACLWLPPGSRCGGFVRTDEEGSFVASFGPGTGRVPVSLVVEADGLPVTAFKVWADSNGGGEAARNTLQMPSRGGGLRIVVPGTAENGPDPSRLLMFHENGGLVPAGLGNVEPVSSTRTRMVSFGNLAPGVWHLYEIQQAADFVALSAAGGSGQGALATSRVVAGQVTTIDLTGATTTSP